MEVNPSLQIDDEIFDALFKVAAKDAMKREMDSLPSLEELNEMYPPSEALDKRVYAVINRDIRTAKRKKAMHVFLRVAAVLCAFIVVSLGALMTVEASRNFIFNMIIEIRGDHVLFGFGQGDTAATIDAEVISESLPQGFALMDSHILEDFTVFIFTNEHGNEVIVQHSVATATIGVDNELREFTVVTINGQNAYVFTALYDYARHEIMWVHGDGVIAISTNTTLDEMLEIAENLIANLLVS